MVNLIFQIIGRFKYDIVNFAINSKIYDKKPLSSIALYEHLKNSKIVYLAPESLVALVAEDIKEAKDMLSDEAKLKEKFKDELKEFFESSMNESIDFEVEVIPSIGVYSSDKGYSLVFEGGIDNVIASIMLNNLKRLAHCEEVIIDVSVGQNIYNAATLEAMRTLQVYYNLKEIIRDESKAPSFKIATCPPIPSAKETELSIPILLFPYNVKTFFEFPYKEDKFDPQKLIRNHSDVKREISQKFGRKQFNNLLEVARLAFNAIKYNAPLAFLQLIEFSEDENVILKNLVEIYNYIESKKEITLNDNKIYIKRLEINRLDLGNYLLTIALYSSLKEFKENINKEKEKTNFEIISEYFPKLYKSKKIGLGLNVRLLKRDLEEIECVVENAKSKGISLKEYVLLKNLYQNRAEERKCDKKGDPKRNFFAHSGLEKTLTYVKVSERDRIELFYSSDRKSEILSWIKNPDD
jgi:CRISPR-associated protein Csx1